MYTCTFGYLQGQVYKELKSYDMVQESPYTDSVFDRFLWSPGSATANDVFSVNKLLLSFRSFARFLLKILIYPFVY